MSFVSFSLKIIVFIYFSSLTALHAIEALAKNVNHVEKVCFDKFVYVTVCCKN